MKTTGSQSDRADRADSASPDSPRSESTKRGQNLRTGYTTGSCAAAAAKAATLALLTRQPIGAVEIQLPIGRAAVFTITQCSIEAEKASCSVIKDAGDDPDATHGAEIGATVAWDPMPGITIRGGVGVGTATKPGLGLPIGAPAINAVPRQMIDYSVREALPEGEGRGVSVTIYVPKGEEIAKKTLNARLGILGGISILGTTGIVTPFSTAAYKACIIQGIDVARANGCERLVFTTGHRSERYAQRLLDLPEEAFIQIADFVGVAVKDAARKGVRGVTMVGMVGKISKIAAGHTQTHVDHSRQNHDFLAQVAAEGGMPPSAVQEIREGNTARHMAEILAEHKGEHVLTRLCELAAAQLAKTASPYIAPGRADQKTDPSMEIAVIMTDFDGNVLGRGDAVANRSNRRDR